jgi:hypothetical protein
VRYESLPHHALLQRARLIADLDAREGSLQLPVYVAISASDAEVDPAAARDWLCRRARGPRRMIWYTPGPAAGTECGAVVERASASAGILDISHIALPIAPDNPRYGAKSAYLDCSHYYWEADAPTWFICMDRTKTAANSEVRQGEITAANLQRHVVRRLTYNPDFEAMAEDLLAFLADPA